ncbi:MAG TPA: helix-turn-helix transcriptional regulator [Bacteroidales bacterium]|nr:helix-turn-helix transcriptional regulator [Bacteroidales bacterium]
MASIGENIRLLRESYGLTQEQVASIIGINRESLSYYENGSRPVPVKYLESFADLFNVDTDHLLAENPEEIRIVTSFRLIDATDEDLKQTSAFRRIVKNYLKLKSLANE